MANPTDAKAANAPYWNNDTVTANVALTGGFDAVTLTGYYVIVSNIGANNVWIGSNNTTQGILLAPGATFETACLQGSPFYVTGTAAQPGGKAPTALILCATWGVALFTFTAAAFGWAEFDNVGAGLLTGAASALYYGRRRDSAS